MKQVISQRQSDKQPHNKKQYVQYLTNTYKVAKQKATNTMI